MGGTRNACRIFILRGKSWNADTGTSNGGGGGNNTRGSHKIRYPILLPPNKFGFL
jgi:hypothetical protein